MKSAMLSGRCPTGEWSEGASVAAGERAINMYEMWCGQARTGVLCWLWACKQLCVVKDIRLAIANLVWDERMAWSEKSAACVESAA